MISQVKQKVDQFVRKQHERQEDDECSQSSLDLKFTHDVQDKPTHEHGCNGKQGNDDQIFHDVDSK